MTTKQNSCLCRLLFLAIIVAGPAVLCAADWPTYRHDNARSGVTDERLEAARLGLAWTWQSAHPPQPAWPGPAKWDAYARIRDLSSMRNYDPVFHISVVGQALYFGSSVDDSMHRLDTRTGRLQWRYTCDGPVRVAPSVVAEKLYFGSDDGHAYCITDQGQLVWRYSPQTGERLVINNGRLISFWPVRTGVLVDGGTAYFAASMLPWRPSYLCAVDALTGKPEGDGRYVREMTGDHTFEGALLGTPERLIVPQGRISPLMFDRSTGKPLGPLDGAGGGSFAVITPDNEIIHGPGNRAGQLLTSNMANRAKMAAFPQAKAMIVAGDSAYLMRARSITALDRKTRKAKWDVPGEQFLSIISDGDTLFAGGLDEVVALAAADGAQRWRGRVDGKAHGLAVADGALFVSTDEGSIYCFRPVAADEPVATTKAVAADSPPLLKQPVEPPQPPVAKIPELKHDALVGRWVFHAAKMQYARGTAIRGAPIPGAPIRERALAGARVADLAGKLTGTVVGKARLARVGPLEVLELDGATASVLLAADHKTAGLPIREITTEAWVRIDRPEKWGGIFGAIQDNGSFERGWILGYSGDKFTFGVNGSGGKDAISYLPSQTSFAAGQWHHVAGTYDGKQLKIYVNGKLENTTGEQQGDINYPPQAFVEIGAYHDQDEYFRLAGMIHEVRLYKQALPADQIARHFKDRQDQLHQTTAPPTDAPALAWGPCLNFLDRRTAVVHWETLAPAPTVLQFGLDGQSRRVTDDAPKTRHEAQLTGLKRNRTYTYRVGSSSDKGTAMLTGDYECDTFFNYTPPVVPAADNPYAGRETMELYEAAAAQILDRSGVRRGICLVLGCVDGRLAYELARRSDLNVIVVDTDAQRVAAARLALHQAGIYGIRVSVMQVDSLASLPLPGSFANLIVSERLIADQQLPGSAAEIYRLLRPAGGMLILGQPSGAAPQIGAAELQSWLAAGDVKATLQSDGQGVWAEAVRDMVPGAGDWTHQYGRADNSSYGGEDLGLADDTSQFVTQWVGRPGPRYQPDRNGRKPGPLAVGGRLFAQGLNRLVALDAYNGTILWSAEIPDLRRMNIPRDAGNWCADADCVYIAVKDKCWRLDAADGSVVKTYDVVRGPNAQWKYDWGFLASQRDLLIGSAVKQAASYTDFWGGENWYDAPHGPQTFKVCSDNLFAVHKETSSQPWRYQGGLIINPTITIGDERVFFVECRNAKAQAADTRRLGMAELWKDQHLVALDAASGEKLWEKPIDTHDGTTVFFMAYAQVKLVIVSSGGGTFHVSTYSAADGKPLWENRFGWPGGKYDHGKAMSRPAIVGNTLFVRPRVFDLTTGKVLEKSLPGGGCGTYACSTGGVFFRAGNVTMYSIENGQTSSWSRLRPGCWLSAIPAAGMLLAPEAGGGCSCGNWMETSIAFAPRTYIPAPRFATDVREFVGSLQVPLDSLTKDGVIRYTVDGTDPTPKSPRYEAPLTINGPTTIKARFFHSNGGVTPVSQATFTPAR